MQPVNVQSVELLEVCESYLGFEIFNMMGSFLAVASGWGDQRLLADSLLSLRKKIWQWWYLLR